MAQLEWEVLRWRRLKVALMRALQVEAVKSFLNKHFEYDLRSEQFVNFLRKSFRTTLKEKSQRMLRWRWRPSMSMRNRTLSTKSTRFSPASN